MGFPVAVLACWMGDCLILIRDILRPSPAAPLARKCPYPWIYAIIRQQCVSMSIGSKFAVSDYFLFQAYKSMFPAQLCVSLVSVSF